MRKYDLKLSGISFYYSFAVLTDTESYFANTIIDYRGEARSKNGSTHMSMRDYNSRFFSIYSIILAIHAV